MAWAKRAAINNSTLLASQHARLATVNKAIPASNTGRQPLSGRTKGVQQHTQRNPARNTVTNFARLRCWRPSRGRWRAARADTGQSPVGKGCQRINKAISCAGGQGRAEDMRVPGQRAGRSEGKGCLMRRHLWRQCAQGAPGFWRIDSPAGASLLHDPRSPTGRAIGRAAW